jgi:AcrR family transcriptional regulator
MKPVAVTPQAPASLGTEERLLRAAELLFAERGIAAVSLRSIMQAAETNVAAVHYHFGSKAALVEAVVRSRIDAVVTARDVLLAKIDPAGPVAPALLAQAFIQPVVDLVDAGGRNWVSIIGNLLASNDPALAPIAENFLERNTRFVQLMRAANPDASMETISFRLTQSMILTLRVLGGLPEVRDLMSGAGARWSVDQVREQLLDVVTSILAGPPVRPAPLTAD